MKGNTSMTSKLSLILMSLQFLGCVSPRPNPEPGLRDTNAGRLMSDYLKICNDQKQLVPWLAQHLSADLLKSGSTESWADEFRQDCLDDEGFRFHAVLQSEPQVIRVLTQGRQSSVWTRFALACDAQGKINRISSMPAFAPRSALPSDLSEANIIREMQTTVQKLNQQNLFSGIVVIARGKDIIGTATAGYANRAKKIPFTAASSFTLGSMSKLFTSVAIGQLVDQKKISYDDTVGKFFPNYANKTIRDKVTVGMLLSHKGGLGDFLDKRTPAMMKQGVTRAAEFVPLFEKDEPLFEPGTSFAYSNSGLALAGAIAEKAGNEAFPDYLRNHIFKPLGMNQSDPNNIPHQDPQLVTPYTHFTEKGVVPEWTEAEPDRGSPGGGAISSAADLVLFANGLRNGKLLRSGVFSEMIKPREENPILGDYGYAVGINEVHGRKIIGHGGGFPGVSTELYMMMDTPYTLVVLSNQDPPAAERVGHYVAAMLAAAPLLK